jgi:hypothetical protein
MSRGVHRRYNAAMSRFLAFPMSRRGITVLALAILVLVVIVALVLLSRYITI